jgi:hypothetical protein
MTLPAVEALLRDPLQIPDASKRWADTLRSAASSSDWVRIASPLLGIPRVDQVSAPPGRLLRPTAGVPRDILAQLNVLVKAMELSQKALDRSVDSLTAAQREAALRAWRSIATNNEQAPQVQKGVVQGEPFDLTALGGAAQLLTQAADEAIPELQASASRARVRRHHRWHFRSGDVVLAGPQDHVFTSAELEHVALLVALGGRHTYKGKVACAAEKQIRLVIDLGEEVTVQAPGESSAGSGVFGIGLMYLPNPDGKKTVLTGGFSQGAGLFGVGGLFVRARQSRFECGCFGQGAGAFGSGIFANSAGTQARYRVRFAGQGAGFTHGVGLFVHKGDAADVTGGLSFPDPREGQAMISLSQGVGYGPRAVAAGGVGMILIEGDHNHLESSYISQGSGYWHGWGGCFVLGNDNQLQARRYDQGAGIHTAVGSCLLKGRHNKTVNWGVGPAYGWDWGVGAFETDGDDNSFQADWGSGHAELNALSLSQIRGDGNRLRLPQWGSGALNQNRPSYAVALCLGRDNRSLLPSVPAATSGPFSLMANPWGAFQGSEGFSLDPHLVFSQPEWPTVDAGPAKEAERKELKQRLQEASGKPTAERIAAWLDVASNFGFDAEGPAEARRNLLSLSLDELPALVSLVSPDSVEEFLQLRLLLSAYGRQALAVLNPIYQQAEGTRKGLVLSLWSACPVHDVVSPLLQALKNSDWRLRRGAVSTLGSLLDQEAGSAPGRLRILQAARELCRRRPSARKVLSPRPLKRWLPMVGTEKYLWDLYSVLALDPGFSSDERRALLQSQTDITSPASAEAWQAFARVLLTRPDAYASAIQTELESTWDQVAPVRRALRERLQDPDTEVAAGALIALGQLGVEEDTGTLSHFLADNAATVREAAACALAKLGDPAAPALQQAMASPSAMLREIAAVSVAQSADSQIQALLLQSMQDADAQVRLAAVSGVSQLYAPTRVFRRQCVKVLKRLARTDPDASVRLNAEIALASLAR